MQSNSCHNVSCSIVVGISVLIEATKDVNLIIVYTITTIGGTLKVGYRNDVYVRILLMIGTPPFPLCFKSVTPQHMGH